jgi:hypothetical protein
MPYGMKDPVSPQLRSECSILAGLAQATLPASGTPWLWYAEDYDRIRDTAAQVLDGFEDFNARYAILRATPPRLMSDGSAVATPVTGRHACFGTRPGSTSSKSPKNPRICSAPRGRICSLAFL